MTKKISQKTKFNNLNGKYHLLLDLIDHIPDVVYFKDRQGRFVMVNKAHAKGLGLKPEQVVGKTDFDIFPKERAELMAKDDEYVMKKGKSIIDKVERATRPDGIDNYVSTTKIPRYNNKGKVIGLMGITRDITRRMQLEKLAEEKTSIEKKIETLQEVNKVKSEFVSIVSHELRTPLAIIKEAVMLILDNIVGPVTDKQKELLNKTGENVERLRKIIDDLLDISRLEGSRLALQYSLIDINDLFKDTSEFFTKLAAQKGIKLEYRLPDKEANIFIDSGRIQQVLTNLINNAIKFTEEGGRIAVEMDVLETMVRIKVSDTGVGIASSDLPRIFNKFVQVSKDASAKKKGVGLGLSISKDLIELHGGQMWVKSQLGVGSQFYFTLPLLYTQHALPLEMRSTINDLLKKNTLLSLIELFIVNYDKFSEMIGVDLQKVSSDLKGILNNECDDLFKTHNIAPQLFPYDANNREFSIVLPEAKEDKAENICKSISSKITDYFKDSNIDNVFTKVDIFGMDRKKTLSNLSIKKVLVGLEVRRFQRFPYSLKVDLGLDKENRESVRTLDISQGGVCFEAKNYLEKDACIDIGLNIPRRKSPVYAKARVAWVRNLERVSDKNDLRYKAGLEFLSLTDKDKEIISSFIGSISAAQ